jgi:iron complex outermembrane receptor protein
MSKNPNLLKPSLLSASVSAALGAMVLGSIAPVYAADEADPALEEIVITGSRIVRRDYDSNSPIVTVDAADFETQTGLNIESYLNQLPEYNPASSPTTTQGDVQITPVNSVGIASISLRGFGANRSLVLVNGKRPTPINPLMVTDINGIPSALIQRVETITGGASAVYGADAVAGVTNFILRDNFEGFELDTQYGMTDDQAGDESRISAILGANIADGRGNVTLGVERYNRDAFLQKDSDFHMEFQRNQLTGGTFGLQGINGYACNFNCPPMTTVMAMFAGRPAGTNVFAQGAAANANSRGYNFNSDGTIWVAGSQGGLYRYKGPRADGEYMPQRAIDTTVTPNVEYTNVKWYDQAAYASAPQERYSFFASGNFDVTDSVNVYARGTFAESKTRTTLFGTSVITGWETQVPYNPTTDSPVNPALNYQDPAVVAAVVANPAAYANPSFIPTGAPGAFWPVPAELAILLNARPTRDAVWQPQWNPDNSLPPRNTYNTNEVYQVEVGSNIDLPIRDWTAEVYASHAESSTYNVATGNLSLARWRALSNQRDYGRNAKGTGNLSYTVGNGTTVPAARPAFGVGDYKCTSGFYDTLFRGDQPMSRDCYEAIAADLQTRTQNKQDIIEVNVQGSLFELPAGEVGAAMGFQNRRNSAKFYPDILQSSHSFTDQVIGVYPTGSLDAGTSVDDFYAEALVPVVNDLPFAQAIELELGARLSQYEHSDDETTWKVLANWEINDRIRVRGGFNRATRAPNLGEMFLNEQEIFTVQTAFGDPCGLRSLAPFGAGGQAPDPVMTAGELPTALAPSQTAAGALSTRMICEEMMGGANTQASNNFYNVANATGAVGGGFLWILQEGNPNLTSEVADTWTLGAVATSPWDNPWLSGLTLALDAYRIEIEDAIMQYSVDNAAARCFVPNVASRAEAQARAQSEGCGLLPRDQSNGAPLTTKISYDNQATIETQGLDISLNWFGDLNELVSLPGSLNASFQATVLDYYRTKLSPGLYDVETDWAGSLGPNLTGTNGGAYDYRLFGSIGYSLDDWNVSLRVRYLPGVYSAAYAQQQAIKQNNAAVAAGGTGILLGYTPTTEIETGAYTVLDLSFGWNINETFALRGGINNLLDRSPEWTAPSSGYPIGTTLSGVCAGLGGGTAPPACQNPAGFSLPGVGTINGGYYDVQGRRFFLGLKASF